MKKHILLLFTLLLLIPLIGSSQGYTRISSQLKQKNDLDFPLIDSYDLLGGAVSGSDRMAVPMERRELGMLFLDSDDGIVYQLIGGLENSNWQKFTGGGLWSESSGFIYYNEGDVKVGKDFYIGNVKVNGDQVAGQGIRIGNVNGTAAGSNIIVGLNHELGSDWDVFKSNLVSSTGNVFIGIDNLYQESFRGDNNVAIGKWTGYSLVNGSENIYVGQSAGERNSDGNYNVCQGYLAGVRLAGDLNIDIGQRAGYGYDNSSSKNVNIGISAGLIFETPGGQTSNVSIGEFAGWKYAGDTSVMIGTASGVEAMGRINTMLGHQAGMYSTGEFNQYFGYMAGIAHNGDSCVFIGNGVGMNYTGGSHVFIDVMPRVDHAYMIDLDGASNMRNINFNGNTLNARVDEFNLMSSDGDLTQFNIQSIEDTTLLYSDNTLRIEGSDLVTDSEIISNNLRYYAEVAYLEIDDEFYIAEGVNGWGTVQAGDDLSFTQFRFSADDVVTIFNNTANVSDQDLDANLCVIGDETGVVVKNRLGEGMYVSIAYYYTELQ
ncbi:MAG TPA: hypothetical protein P5514_12425 [Bacteroidales bacterium]|nr:hypothetical protein [Bacteroidales bacterium]HRX97744.1 hypothetical protein [Bacteroidales bacterium]